MLKNKCRPRRAYTSVPQKKVIGQMYLYKFPVICGLETISEKLNKSPSTDIFGALLHAYPLKPISSPSAAMKAERMLEYLGRAFEEEVPNPVKYYQHVLVMLLKEYDDQFHVRASHGIPPNLFLKELLLEDRLTQKSLVPDCFPTESQVSEFLHQKQGRQQLKYSQAVALGKKFKVDPRNFCE